MLVLPSCTNQTKLLCVFEHKLQPDSDLEPENQREPEFRQSQLWRHFRSTDLSALGGTRGMCGSEKEVELFKVTVRQMIAHSKCWSILVWAKWFTAKSCHVFVFRGQRRIPSEFTLSSSRSSFFESSIWDDSDSGLGLSSSLCGWTTKSRLSQIQLLLDLGVFKKVWWKCFCLKNKMKFIRFTKSLFYFHALIWMFGDETDCV